MRIIISIIILTSAILVNSQFSTEVNADSANNFSEKLHVKIIDAVYNETPLTEVVRDIASKSGARIAIHPKVKQLIDPDEVYITLSARQLSAENTLKAVANQVELKILFEHNVFWLISAEDYYSGRNVVKIYDVKDIACKIKNFQGITIRLRGNAVGIEPVFPGCDDDDDVNSVPTEDLAEYIPDYTAKENWSNNPGASVQQLAGMLIIRQTPEAHYEIKRFLSQIRANR